ncbi:uncharacterized protein V2V93DRAFT_365052 [Kockiozyma suomiensis]|uniref:uncharacterized protein n=1 Tax=Kockiozyma suomiensis TaxID=1337062 RepID=UPI003342F903
MAKPGKNPAFQEVKIASANNNASSSLSRLRKKIRDLERLLKRSAQQSSSAGGKVGKNTTALAHREQERALRALKLELASAETGSQAKKLERRYHQVRFFERRKADRKVVKGRKVLNIAEIAYKTAKAGEDKELKSECKRKRKDAERKLKLAEHELAYIVCFPEQQKYVSLYVDGGLERLLNERTNVENEDKTDKKRREWWDITGQMLESGQIDVNTLLFGYHGDKPWKAATPNNNTGVEDDDGQELEQAEFDGEEEEEDEFFEK